MTDSIDKVSRFRTELTSRVRVRLAHAETKHIVDSNKVREPRMRALLKTEVFRISGLLVI